MRLHVFAAVLLLAAPMPLAADVTRVDITSRRAVAGGQAFGDAGPYERLSGTIAFALDPRDPRNARIADLGLAPRGSDGRVHFTADLYVLKPVDPSRGNGVLFFEASNRGRKGLITRFNTGARAADDPDTAADFGDGLLLREGYTLVWVGWEFDVDKDLLSIDAPRATIPADAPPMSVPFIADERVVERPLRREAPTYAPARPDDPASRLTVRDAHWAQPVEVARARWRFVPGAPVTTVALDGGFEPGRIYEVTYRPAEAPVVGVGLAALRDTASAFRYRQDMPAAGRAAIVFGSSQTGRFLREFLFEGFNADERGRRVFDGVWPHIAGAARGSFNERYSTPIALDSFDQTLTPYGDILGAYDGAQRPKVIYTNTSVEYWGQGRAAALIHTTPDGAKDVDLPENVRVYLFAGTQHGEAAFPPARTNGQAMNNPMPQRAVMRALLHGLRRWVTDGASPPPSRYPRLADGTLTPVAGLKFPSIPGVRDPRGAEGPGERRDGRLVRLPFLVPQVDADGNEMAGIRVPEQAVPLATTTGWNFRSEEKGNPQALYYLLGSYLPFPATRAQREAEKDSRLSIPERYRDREEYLARIDKAAAELASGGYLLAEDLAGVRARAAAHWDYAARAASESRSQR
jgi:hypothetical protein